MLQKLVQDARQTDPPLHWLDLQDADRYKWHEVIGQGPETSGRKAYYRHLGIVEGLFDSDGSLWCGRADLHHNHVYELRTSLTDAQLRERIVLAWTLMRHSHVLLSAQARFLHEIVPREPNHRWTSKCFVYHRPRSIEEAVEETRPHVRFVEDSYPDPNVDQFYQHVLNTNRAFDSKSALSKLYVMPLKRTSPRTARLHLIANFAHQITDGLTVFRWTSQLAQTLNRSEVDIRCALETLLGDPQNLRQLMPPSQESLYPVRSPNVARQRWHWLITRILRHVRIPPPAGFPNPLRRAKPPLNARTFPTTYDKILDYTVTPPLNGGFAMASIHGTSSQKLRRLCKEARISLGSGCFTLIALVMMALEEQRHPDIPLPSRLPFVGSFPVNPRPFLSSNTTGQEDSCMLAFSDGVTLPFLPTSLPFAGRFKLLGRLAHTQLRQYQKRPRSLTEEVHLGSRSPNQLLPALYCSTLERLDSRFPTAQQAGVTVQGAYPARTSPGPATCGISSVGEISTILTPTPPAPTPDDNLDALLDNPHSGGPEAGGTRDLVARFQGMFGAVRPRDGEFLVGASGDSRTDSFWFNVSFDATAIDEARVGAWRDLIEGALEAVEVDGLDRASGGGGKAKL